ncbi:MAG: hypothetical protein QOJ99_2140 [Bryobacterales bacterium]|jgi:uncharacterized iron-regulated membrane protein|nr:hypothetical protein [Bryobacterales bacterium]
MTVRSIVLKVHLFLGLVGAVFLLILGLTGSIIAFETDIPHWLNPNLFSVKPGPRTVPEQELVRLTEAQFAPARVNAVQFLRHPDLARVMQLPGGVRVFVNPYTGAILGSVIGPFTSERTLGYIHQIHLRLVPDPRATPQLAAPGKTFVSFAGLILCLLVPTWLFLFWRTRRTTVKWSASWFRISFDLHHVIGIYAALFLLTAAFTGIIIGFEFAENTIYARMHSERPGRPAVVESRPASNPTPITIDQAIAISRAAMPDPTLAGYSLPHKPKDVFAVMLRVPEETSDFVHSSVAVDQFSGRVLQVQDFRTDSPGFFWVRYNRSIHTGDILGTPTHILLSVSSLLLVVMVCTGPIIWWRKLAV